MKLGCFGCLTIFTLVLLCGGVVWGVMQALREPDIQSTAVAPADGVRAQQKIFEIARRGGHPRDRDAEPIVFAEGELNAFLARHLGESTALPLTDISLRLERGGIAEVRARLPLGYLLREQPTAMLEGFLPGVWLDRRVWLRVGVRPGLESDPARRARRYLRLEVTDFAVGRQRLPAPLLRILLDPTALSVLRLRVPDGIDAVTVEAGRLVVRPAS